MATENIFTVQLNTSGEMPQPFEVRFDCKFGKITLSGDDKEIDLKEVIILPVMHKYKNTKMYNIIKFPNTEPCDYVNIYFVHLGTGNIFSGLVKKSSEGRYVSFIQSVLAFGKPEDLLHTKVTFSFKEESSAKGTYYTLQFNKSEEKATAEQVQAIADFFAATEKIHMISHRNVQQYATANNLDLSETMATLLPPPQKTISNDGLK